MEPISDSVFSVIGPGSDLATGSGSGSGLGSGLFLAPFWDSILTLTPALTFWPWISGLGSPGVGSDAGSGPGFVSGCAPGSVLILWPRFSGLASVAFFPGLGLLFLTLRF